MVFDAVKMMRSFVEKILKGGIQDTKIGIKSGNPFQDFALCFFVILNLPILKAM